MPERICLFVFLVILAVGCGAASPAPTESQAAPTAVIAATVEAATSSSQSESPTPTKPESAPTETPTIVPTEEPTPEPTATPSPTATPLPPGMIVVEPSEIAQEMTNGLLLNFAHSAPEYTDAARGALLHVEDGNFCDGALLFVAIAKDGRERFGERLTSATYNAGVIFMALGWEDTGPHSPVSAGCVIYSASHPRGLLEPGTRLARKQLDNVLPHLSDTRSQAGAQLMLGKVYANASIRAGSPSPQHTSGGSIGFGPDTEREQKYATQATEHLCQSIDLHDAYEALALEILEEIDRTCN